MAEGLSAATANAILAAIFQSTSYSVADVYVKLHVGAPGAAGTSNPAGNTVRANASTAFGDAPAGGEIVNDAAIGTTEWASVSTSETYTHASLWTASSGGTFIASGSITSAAVTASDPFEIPIGDLTASFPIAS